MKKITDIEIQNSRVLIRVDFNVPILDGVIQSDFRIRAAKNTIDYCLSKNASVILISHLGRPSGNDSSLSLSVLQNYLSEYFSTTVHFSDDCISDIAVEQSLSMNGGEIHLLENLRFYKEENLDDEVFACKLSAHADVYINDAFGTSHRKHASNSSILKYFNKKAIGFLMEREINFLKNSLEKDNKSILVVGGAKISTKLKMLKNFIHKSTHILIGGAMAFTFLKAKGVGVGKSLVEDDMIDEALEILSLAKKNNVKLVLPVDVVCSEEYSNNSEFRVCSVENIMDTEMGLDIGPETTMIFEMILEDSESVIWNGPLGAFELSNFSTGTHSIAHCISRITSQKDVTTIIGGGDTASSVILCNLDHTYTHVSTGGGASLELLSGEELKIISSWRKYE